MSDAERELLKRAKAGDCQGFQLLFMPHYEDAYRLARCMLRGVHQAEDAAQETFLRALRGLAKYRGDATPRNWLLRICRNECLDRQRKPREWSLDECLAEAQDRTSGELAFDPCQAWDSDIDFWPALAGLAPEEREAWFLVDAMGYTSKDAAEVVEVPPSTVRSRLYRARKGLLSALGEWPTPELARGEHADVWGLYHSPPATAIVLSFGLGTATASDRPRPSVEQLLAALTVRSGAAASSLSRVNGYDMFGFLELLDGEAPSGQEMVALIDHRSTTQRAAADWRAGHPRWCLRPLTHRDLGKQVERLLDIREVLTLIGDRGPFVWIKTEHERLK